jgi:glycosyltransferase involved in cell wall biosynthesis
MGLIEALSYGIPCIATKGTNMAEEIFDADAGWVAENEMTSVKDALLQMCSTEDFSKKGDNARNLAQKYSWDSIAMNSHDEYEKILGESV